MSDVAEPTREGSEAGERICWKCGETYGSHLQYCPEDGAQLVELDPTDEGDLLVGTVFDDRFRILSVLGEGGMSRVYHARQIDNEEHVALKILKADFLRDEEIRKRFMYEARVIAGLDHRAAVNLHDFGQAPDGSFYMVMELLEGESLANRLRRRFISYEEIFAFTVPTCGVMAEAHRDDVIHRDLKPENIYLTHIEHQVDQPKLLDFGIAKHLRMGTMTQSDARWGTPAYMSPEQASGDPVQGTADVYALGVMLYELIAGILPFRASTAMGFAVKHMHKDVRPMRDLPGMNDVVPGELDELVIEMMAKEPEDRPGSMEAVQRRLESVRDAAMMESLRQQTPAEKLNRDEINLEPDDAESASDGSGVVQVNEELKSAHTVFVGDEADGENVEGPVANLLDPEAPTPPPDDNGASMSGIRPSRSQRSQSFEAERDTAEMSLQFPLQTRREWWIAGAAVAAFAGVVLGFVWFSSLRGGSDTSESASTGSSSKAMMFGTDASAEMKAKKMGAGPEAAESVGKAAGLAARIAVRARSIAVRVGSEVQARPASNSTKSESNNRRTHAADSDQAARKQTAGSSDRPDPSEDQSETKQETSSESVREALEGTF